MKPSSWEIWESQSHSGRHVIPIPAKTSPVNGRPGRLTTICWPGHGRSTTRHARNRRMIGARQAAVHHVLLICASDDVHSGLEGTVRAGQAKVQPAKLVDLKNGVDFHRCIERQARHPHRRAGMPPRLAEYLNGQV